MNNDKSTSLIQVQYSTLKEEKKRAYAEIASSGRDASIDGSYPISLPTQADRDPRSRRMTSRSFRAQLRPRRRRRRLLEASAIFGFVPFDGLRRGETRGMRTWLAPRCSRGILVIWEVKISLLTRREEKIRFPGRGFYTGWFSVYRLTPVVVRPAPD